MKTIYIDSEFKCHVENDGTMTAVETDFFDQKCNNLIECYMYVPEGQTWTRDDGVVFEGGMITLWKSTIEVEEEQILYERQLLVEYTEALKTLGVTL